MALTKITDRQVTYKQGATGSVVRNLGDKLRESISVKDFGAVGDGIADDTAAIQAAVTYVYANAKSLRFPAGTYLMSSTITMGNTVGTAATFCHFFGEGKHSIIKVTAANVNPFLWQGPNPEVDGATNRIDGRILLEKIWFQGPASFGANTNSIGVKFYGVQGIMLRDCLFTGWYDGEHYKNCDIVSRYNVHNTGNYNGVNSSASGYAITGEGQLNSFNSYGGLVNGNTNWGIQYVGGIAPSFFGVNFVLNGVSLVFSPNNAAGATVTEAPTVSGCYFEGDTGTTILLGGGNGIVRGGVIEGGFMISAAATALITVANYSNSFGRGRIAIAMDTGFAGSSQITQATSAEKIDFYSINGQNIGEVTPALGYFTQVRSGTITKTGITAGASVDILNISGPADSAGLTLTIHSTSTGIATAKKYAVLLMGAGNAGAGAITILAADDYAGGPSAFTLSEVANSPGFGTNKLVLTNNSAATCIFTIAYTVEYSRGSIVLL